MLSAPEIAMDAVGTFVKRHETCGAQMFDVPPLPQAPGFRVLVACRCGDTFEQSITDPNVPTPRIQDLYRLARRETPPRRLEEG